MRRKIILVAAASACNATPFPQAPSTAFNASAGIAAWQMINNTTAVPLGPAPKGCSKYEMIIARGTGEPGPFGTIVGDPLVAAVTKELPDSRGYAVQYPANMSAVSPQIGIDDAINRLNLQHQQCPEQTFMLAGYSQGAGVIHGTVADTPYANRPADKPKLNQAVLPKIKAIVLFGDGGFKGTTGRSGQIIPPIPKSLEDRLRQNCHQRDPACDPAGGGFENHMEYIRDPYQKDSKEFVLAAFKGQPLPKAPRFLKDVPWAPKI